MKRVLVAGACAATIACGSPPSTEYAVSPPERLGVGTGMIKTLWHERSQTCFVLFYPGGEGGGAITVAPDRVCEKPVEQGSRP